MNHLFPRALHTGAALLLGLSCAVHASAAEIKAGQYDALMLAVTPDHQVEGYYSETLGQGVTRTCSFYLKGPINGDGAVPLNTWEYDSFPGSLKATADGVSLTIEKGREHSGCASVMMPQIATGLDLSRYAEKPWIGLLKISADKAYLRKQARGSTSKRPYIVKDDVVGVLAFKDGWAKVEFINDNDRSFSGWISQEQYSRLVPPKP
ncbi:hypothetical protein Q7C30_014395 [Pseudomonas sp. RAC1]|uniref:hypothetical protein n=1 Tax=Pseudomonas sp. RAC1 TaxID=3064900 RepID=UPI00271CC3FB|nr:hypothetical protein [Pseudomonas sp. RAC1]MDV9033277.1 hypothetical protein [Pseudomonas sp. RAC1]